MIETVPGPISLDERLLDEVGSIFVVLRKAASNSVKNGQFPFDCIAKVILAPSDHPDWIMRD